MSTSMPHNIMNKRPAEGADPSPKDHALAFKLWLHEHPFAKTTLTLSVAGVVPGVPADILMHPMYRVGTVLHTQDATKLVEGTTATLYKGVMDAIRGIYRADGVKGLYRGMPAVLSGSIPGTALFFMGMQGTFEVGQTMPCINPLAGYVGQFFASLVYVPTSVLSEKQQARGFNPKYENMGLIRAVMDTVKTDGVFGLYRGMFPQLVTFGTCHAVALNLAGRIKDKLKEAGFEGVGADFVANASAYGMAAGATNWMEVVKKYLQVAHVHPEAFPFKNAWQAFVGIIEREGVKGLWVGTGARVGWLAPRMGFALTAFEVVRKAVDSGLDVSRELESECASGGV